MPIALTYRNLLPTFALFAATSASAQSGPTIGYTVETSVASTYTFRGVPQYTSTGIASSQNTLQLRVGGVGPGRLSLTVWNAVAMQSFDQQTGAAVEIDGTIGYGLNLSQSVSLDVGYVGYGYPLASRSGGPIMYANEFFAQVTVDTPIVTPSFAVYAEPFRYGGLYASGAVTRDFAFGEFHVRPTVSLGLAGYDNYNATGVATPLHLHDLSGSVEVRWNLPAGTYMAVRGSSSYRGTQEAALNFPQRWTGFASMAFGVDG
jgi:uncharacterized protein (TIGR02001 family)